MLADVICPKCQGLMRTVDRQAIRLEQCETCRGIFLDRGELEQILTAEQQYYGGGAAPYAAPGPGQHGMGHHGVEHPGVEHHGGYPGHTRPYGDSPRPYRDSPHPYRDSPRPYRGDHREYYADSPRPYKQRHGHGSFLGDLFG